VSKTFLEEKKVSNQCFLNTYISYDEENYILEINYLDGKFIAEKLFANNINGVAKMEETIGQIKNEDDIRRYFGII
jgi:hypothetical protein